MKVGAHLQGPLATNASPSALPLLKLDAVFSLYY